MSGNNNRKLMKEKKLYALGVGHNTPVFIDIAEQCGYKVVGLYHYNNERTGEIDHGFCILGSFNHLFATDDLQGKSFLLTMGDNTIRSQLIERIISLGGDVPTLIHPTAVVSRFARISSIGVYVGAFTHVQADTEIEQGTVILSGVNISHTNHIGKYCFVAGGATIGAYTVVEDYVFVGQGALSISGKVGRIGCHSCVGAKSLLTKEVNAFSVVMGSPAREIKKDKYLQNFGGGVNAEFCLYLSLVA